MSLTGFIVCLIKRFLLFRTALLKYFIYIRSGKNSLPFNLFTTYPQKKCNHEKNHSYLNLVYSNCHRVNIYRLAKLLDFLFLLLFLVSYPSSTATLRFPHSSSMSIGLGKPTVFLIPSIPAPSSSSSIITTFSEELSSSSMKTLTYHYQ